MDLLTELEAFIHHPGERPSHVPGAPEREFDASALAAVDNIAGGALRGDGELPDPAKQTAEVERYTDMLAEPLLRLMKTSRRPNATLPFNRRFGYTARSLWDFSEMTAPYLAPALKRLLDAGDIQNVLASGLDTAAFARDHELMVAMGSDGKIPWIPVIFEILADAINRADSPTLKHFVEAARVIDRTWPNVSYRIALSRVLGPGLSYVREGKRLLELQLTDDVRAEIERASSGFGSMFPARIYRDLDFLFGGFIDWHDAALGCADVVDSGARAIRAEIERMKPHVRENARLLPRFHWLEFACFVSERHLDSLLRWRLLLAQATVRLEMHEGRSRPSDLQALLADLPARFDSQLAWNGDELEITSIHGGGPFEPDHKGSRFSIHLN
jgi:hypothetical protein